MTAADFVRSITPYNFSADAVVGLSDTLAPAAPLPPSVAVRCQSHPSLVFIASLRAHGATARHGRG